MYYYLNEILSYTKQDRSSELVNPRLEMALRGKRHFECISLSNILLNKNIIEIVPKWF